MMHRARKKEFIQPRTIFVVLGGHRLGSQQTKNNHSI